MKNKNKSVNPKQVKFGKIIEYSIGGTKISDPNFDNAYETISDGNDADDHFKTKADEIAFIKQHKNDIIENGVSNSDHGYIGGDNGDWFNNFTVDGVNFCILADKAFFKKAYPYEDTLDSVTTINDVIEKVVGYNLYSPEFKEKLKTMDYKSWLTLDNFFSDKYRNLNPRSYVTFLKKQGEYSISDYADDKCESKLDKKDEMYMNTCGTVTDIGKIELHIKTKNPLFKNNKLIK